MEIREGCEMAQDIAPHPSACGKHYLDKGDTAITTQRGWHEV